MPPRARSSRRGDREVSANAGLRRARASCAPPRTGTERGKVASPKPHGRRFPGGRVVYQGIRMAWQERIVRGGRLGPACLPAPCSWPNPSGSWCVTRSSQISRKRAGLSVGSRQHSASFFHPVRNCPPRCAVERRCGKFIHVGTSALDRRGRPVAASETPDPEHGTRFIRLCDEDRLAQDRDPLALS